MDDNQKLPADAKSAAPVTVPRFVAAKRQKRRLAVLTAYDYTWAGIVDAAGVDAILVGDTLGMVVQGHDTTLPVTLDEMIYHAEMVTRAVKRALVIVDMPFMTYQVSPETAIANAGRILKETRAACVKIEGGVNQAETIRAMTAADIPVMAHVGLKPQSVRMLGGMGKIQRDEQRLLDDARAAQDAGAFGIVLELIPRQLAAAITAELEIPTIGIGAGPDCDGQVLVLNDMLGLTDGFQPKFLKRYAELHGEAVQAATQYVTEVREGSFPDDAHSHD
ncbi:MAG: 3-methyl-2-oxobutanoate hydroxymethyltransferase [Planctomycetaceae bacterium]|jgi:3-methyl-2-oxobutanoate hydroxymethyltransferase|nr:3-methyl-2-oxobutanoate hydroxymethyltransferase [Planctomycetaceae bacterium]MBT6157274.1 3-methyl-2-oxobutanoate hydroxymethyltransferase [Planctomycetaceae bacterium]MBT6486796.1 3-methyl-2-oxobutanoate hydroxymethyltransferase [Planctomycetaceae bacterium]MBT6493359.1 3-methyl-2-oxobutanoate hydroxymethyltransferase [Planctomycetaceae bacterium]